MEESGEHSRRRNRRRRPLAPHSEPVWRDPITREESRFRAGETGLSRHRRSRTRSEASSSADAPADSGAADPDPPARPQPRRAGGFTLLDPDGTVWGPFTTAGEHMQYDRTQGRQRPGTRSQQSQASSSSLSASPRSDHPGAESGTRVRQSVLYLDRPRRSQPRRQMPAEEHPVVMSSSEPGRVVADLPTFEVLSLSDPALLTLQTADDADETDDDEVPPEPIGFGLGFGFGFGFGTLAPQTLHYPARPPRPEWLGGVRGQAVLEEHASDASSSELDPLVTDSPRFVSSLSRSEKPTEDSDDDTEEQLRLLKEYFDANPPTSISQAFAELESANLAALVSQAAELGVEQLLAEQANQKASAAFAHPQHSAVPRKPRQEASTEESVENAKKWMRDEVTVVFQNYIGRRDDLKIVDYHLDELCHQCVSVENYHNIFHHYNFTVKLKKANSDDWTGALYFAEVKQVLGRKVYFCCPLEPNENGLCYACQNQGMHDLRQPATGGFDEGLPDVGFSLWYPDD